MSKYRMVKVKKAGGGHRLQRAMVLASGRLKFVKNTGGASRRKARKPAMAKRRRRRSHAIVRHRRSHTRRYHPRRSRRRRGGGSMPLVPIALGAAGLAFLTGKSGPKQVTDLANKIPGAKTFGPLAVLGAAAWAVDHFGVYRSRWLKIAGVVGVTAAAIKVGTEGAAFKWVGDSDDIGDYDLADVEGDDDMGDVEGDDDLGDDED